MVDWPYSVVWLHRRGVFYEDFVFDTSQELSASWVDRPFADIVAAPSGGEGVMAWLRQILSVQLALKH